MNVSDMMTQNPVTIDKSSPLHTALQAMSDIGCHHLPVTSKHGHVVGILSDHDCRRALNWPHLWKEGWQNETVTWELFVYQFMTPAPIVVEPDTPADEAARLMLVNHISCLPVMRAETLVGIVTTSDLLVAFMTLSRREKSLPYASR
jgi:acetoin utilization protein AcuB